MNIRFKLPLKVILLQNRSTHIADISRLSVLFWGTTPCADITASFSGLWKKTHMLSNEFFLHFLPIVVSFSTYLIIFTSDKM